MRNGYRSILLLLIALIVAGGVLLFILRDQLLDVLRTETGVNELMFPGEMVVSSARNALDVEIFSAPAFTTLKDNVVKFDFDNICKQSGSVNAPVSVIVTETGEETEETEEKKVVKTPIKCVLGNNAPFFIKNKN